MSIFVGHGIAMVTPFGENRFHATQKLLEHYGENADALIVLGTTGEASTMTTEEKVEFIKFVKSKTHLPIVVGAGSNCTKTCCDNVKRYADLGVDGLLVVTPYYNKCTQDGLFEHYQRVCEEGAKVIAYNVPSRTGVNILPSTAKKLVSIKNLVGLKEASGNFLQMMETLRLTEGKIDLYSGEDELNVPAILMGYKGAISVTGNVAPNLVKSAIDYSLQKDCKNASRLATLLSPLNKSLFLEVNPIPVKMALNIMGFMVGEPRLPLSTMSLDNAKLLENTLKELNLIC